MKLFTKVFDPIINPHSLFRAWEIFKSDKQKKSDVLEFGSNIEEHIFKLHRDLREKTYKHEHYVGFYIHDPKRRHIHKATVRDRVLHHAIFRVLNFIFEPTFIPTSFSCRINKGTHRGVESVANMLRKVSKNNTKTCYALKCDVRKFFDSVDHSILVSTLEKKIQDPDALWLLREIIESYQTPSSESRERERVRRYAPKRNTDRQSYFPNLCQCLYE